MLDCNLHFDFSRAQVLVVALLCIMLPDIFVAYYAVGCWLLFQTVTGRGSTFLNLGLDGSTVSEGLHRNYISGSLFDDSSSENCGAPTVYSFDSLKHADVYTEAYVCDRYGAFWFDYLFTASEAISDGNFIILLTCLLHDILK